MNAGALVAFDAPLARTRAPSDLGEQALGLVLRNAAARRALLTRLPSGRVERAGRDAVRLASKRLRAVYDEHVTRATLQTEGEGFAAGVSPRRFSWPQLREVEVYGAALSAAAGIQLRAAIRGWPRLQLVQMHGVTWYALKKKVFSAPLESLRYMLLCPCPSPSNPATPSKCLKACRRLKSTRLPQLKMLDLPGWVLNSACVAQLAGASWPRLEDLDLRSCKLAAGTLAALAAAPWADGLKSLRLADCNLEPPSIRELSQGRWAQLRLLNLEGNPIEDGLADLLAAPWVAGLEELFLSHTGLMSAEVELLLGVEWQRLESLDLRGLLPEEDDDELDEHDFAEISELDRLVSLLRARHPRLEVRLYNSPEYDD